MPDLNRRRFIAAGSTAGGALVATACAAPDKTAAAAPALLQPPIGDTGLVDVTLHVNGALHRAAVDPRTTLLDTLREHLDLTGTKKGCDQGQCGACTVHLDGQRVLSCLTLALAVAGRKVTTIEGLTPPDGALHPMQQAFIDQDAFQCGYCTPGQIMSGVACVNEGHAGSPEMVREYMSGNLCRCAAYPNIVMAVLQARQAMKAGGAS